MAYITIRLSAFLGYSTEDTYFANLHTRRESATSAICPSGNTNLIRALVTSPKGNTSRTPVHGTDGPATLVRAKRLQDAGRS